MSLEHAKHNESLCNKLHVEQCYFDWIITTAFYSAFHYSEFQLFPFILGPTEYSNFDVYYDAFKRNKDNKHDARKRLVYSNINPLAGAAYNWLKDLCWTARYYDYDITKEEADVALNKLNIIKTHVTKINSPTENN